MMKRLLLIGMTLFSLGAGTMALVAPSTALAATPKEEICSGVGAASGAKGCDASNTQIDKIIAAVVNVMSVLVGVVAVIMVIVSGFTYVTSAGDSGKITTAKHTLIYAIVGIVIVFLAQFIVQFVLSKL